MALGSGKLGVELESSEITRLLIVADAIHIPATNETQMIPAH